jgi:hypothetical protein
MTFERSLAKQGHALRWIVTKRLRGWEIRQERDSVVERAVVCGDWHRVERELRLIDRQLDILRRAGWMDVPPPGVSRVIPTAA